LKLISKFKNSFSAGSRQLPLLNLTRASPLFHKTLSGIKMGK
jgi:hypothetical protein